MDESINAKALRQAIADVDNAYAALRALAHKVGDIANVPEISRLDIASEILTIASTVFQAGDKIYPVQRNV